MRTLAGLVWPFQGSLLPVILSIAPNSLQCLALSERFYNNYLEAQSLLRGGIGTRALRDLDQFEHRSHLPRCEMGYIKNQKHFLCNINYGSSEDLPTMDSIPTEDHRAIELKVAVADPAMATMTLRIEISTATLPNANAQLPTVLSVVSSTIVTPLATEEHRKYHHSYHHDDGRITESSGDPESIEFGDRGGPLGGEFFSRLEYTSTAYPTPTRMTGFSRGELIKLEMNFEQVAKADSASASASLYLSYNPMWDTIAITGSHTASIATWTTSTIYDVVNVSPFPYGPETEFKYWVSGEIDVAVSRLSEVCRRIEEVASKTKFIPILTEVLPVSSSPKKNVTLQGSFFGIAVYNSATATWNGRWGPYDSVARTLPFNATVSGADGPYTRFISEDWSVNRPFSEGNEADLIKSYAEIGPIGMVSQVGLWHTYRFKDSNTWGRSNPLARETRVPIRIDAVGSTNALLTARGAVTITVPAVTEIVTQTKTVTNTHIPLFGRFAKAKGTSAERRTDQGSRFLLWLPWIIFFWVLIFICSFSLIWHRLSGFIERQWRRLVRFFRPEIEPTDSSFWNIIPTIRRPAVRKVSGSEVIDPARLQSARHRGSKESFQSVELD
ncbi:hypothetical protein TWF970_008803 [Orbilia oligospora]|uniref:Uncharacterized protein n=1 Tax=Orbilia oligospora TaxID=2813651 RepID=A0A7C8RJM6_ORBOL|nr:hypothetical protein TWF970_008803 [Orbilia oligospora]